MSCYYCVADVVVLIMGYSSHELWSNMDFLLGKETEGSLPDAQPRGQRSVSVP